VRDQLPLFAPPAEAPLGDEAVRVKLVVAYDGRDFAGFAPNVGVRTVGGTLEAALERVLRHPVELAVAGRTDAGVHAGGQVVSFDARAQGLDLPRLQRALNRMLRPAIAVRSAEVADRGFDARFSARSRRYRYLVLNRPTPDPFLAATAWHVEAPLDLSRMRLACDPLIGEHDFSSFCRRPKGDGEISLVRRVLDARWTDEGGGQLRFDIEATAFCHQMVRSIVGTLVDVGRGRLRAGQVKGILAARDRSAAGEPAPPHGLSLEEVVYG
jgi:tRNA pseudouridine38-40 synthase